MRNSLTLLQVGKTPVKHLEKLAAHVKLVLTVDKFSTEQVDEFHEITRDVMATALLHLGILDAYADVTFVNCTDIQELNRTHRGVDRVTDVLSFPLGELDRGLGKVLLGDIVICLERAWQQADDLGHDITREVAFLCLHGLLHLLGFEHDAMEALYEPILIKAGYTR